MRTVAAHPARLTHVFAAEWIKFWSLRSTPVVLAAVTAWYVFRSYQDAQASYAVWLSLPPGLRDGFDPSGPFRGPEWFLMMVVAASVGALVVVGEHASGLIRPTFTAVPDRLRVAAAKILVVAVSTTGVGALVTACSFALTAMVLHSHHIGFSLGDAGAPSLVASTTLMVPLCALAGLAIGAVVRNTATTIIVICVLFVLVPIAFKSDSTRWAVDVANALPCYAWARLTTMGHGHVVGGGPSYSAAWTAFACWIVASAVVVAVNLHRRDV